LQSKNIKLKSHGIHNCRAFSKPRVSKAVSEGLENNGFKNENYIIYLEEKKHSRSLFGVNFHRRDR
jgi:hypothetical protein